jgi:hypothetical protein
MTNINTPSSVALMPSLEAAWQDVDISFDRFFKKSPPSIRWRGRTSKQFLSCLLR